jgi:hypothetical protein
LLAAHWLLFACLRANAAAAATAAPISCSMQGLEDVEGVPMPEVDEQLGPLQQEVCNYAVKDTAPWPHTYIHRCQLSTAV